MKFSLNPERRQVLRELWETQHPWAVQSQVMADYAPNPAYGDFGQWATLVFAATDQEAYAAKAYRQMMATFTDKPPGRNETRECHGVFALHYPELRPAISDREAAEWRRRLFAWCDLALQPQGAGWGTLRGDSDEETGNEAGVRLTCKVLAAEEPERCAEILANPQIAMWREDIDRFCDLAAGGEWIESSEYNLGTLQLLLMGAYGDDIAKFPKVATLANAVADQQAWNTLPDGTYVDWGDVQSPLSEHLNDRVGLLSMLAGLTGSETARRLLASLIKDKPTSAYWFNIYRALWCFDPRSLDL